jgi:transcriptional regulator GlxA family with amidase domain
MILSVGIFLFDEVEVLDFSGPFEVFSSAKDGEKHVFDVYTIAEDKRILKSYGNLKIQVDYTIHDHPKLDVLIIPGGYGIEKVNIDIVKPWLHRQFHEKTILASICTGAFILAKSNLLNGLKATTHFEDTAILEHGFPEIEVIKNARFVDNGQILCSSGISAGIDLSLYLLEKLKGKTIADKCRKRMEWTSP